MSYLPEHQTESEIKRSRRGRQEQDDDVALFAAFPTNDVQAEFLQAQEDAKRGNELDGGNHCYAVQQADGIVVNSQGNPVNYCHQTRTIRPWFPRHFVSGQLVISPNVPSATSTTNGLGTNTASLEEKGKSAFGGTTGTINIPFTKRKPQPTVQMAHSGTSFPFGSNAANNNTTSSAPSQQTTAATSLFGNTATTSASSQQTTTSLFGNSGANTTSVFGQSSTASGGNNTGNTGFKFNSTASGGTGTTAGNLFSSNNATNTSGTSLFGNAQTTSNTGGLFGSGSASKPSSAQANNSASTLFGGAGAANSATQPGANLFSGLNSNSTSQAPSGSLTATPFQNKSLTTTSSTTPQGQPPASTSLFGQPKQNENQAPGSNTGGQTQSLFGNTGGSGTSLFGEVKRDGQISTVPPTTQPQASSTTNLFSAPSNPTPAANTNTSNLFGGAGLGTQTTSAPASSAPAASSPAPASNLFSGLGTQTSSATSQPATTTTTASTNTSSNLFSAPAAGSASSTNLFNAPATSSASSTSLFGAPATSSGGSTNLFNAQPATTTSSTNPFGTPAANPTASTNQAAAPASTGAAANTSLFSRVTSSQPASTGTSLFSGSNAPQPASTGATTGTTAPSVAPAAAPGATGSSTLGTSLFGAAGGTAAGAATSSTSGPAPPSHSRLAQKSMDEIITMWSTSLASHQKTFKQLASQVSTWDHMLVENSSKISSLYCRCFQAERDCSEVERQLSVVEHGQSELEALLDRYEHDIDKMIEQTGTGDDGMGGVDGERERTYKTAEACSTRLTEMSHSLTDMIEEINAATSKISNNSARGAAAANDPLSQIVRVLNSHLSQLQTIDSGATELKEKVDAAKKDQRVLTQSQGINGGGGWLDDFGRSYLGRRL